ncbi:hypothetical protein HK102_000878 [Quaeritorhiza haematococci]|nr:hypothetical protein HK102_000878 [Quaeritorhiza haematococci]
MSGSIILLDSRFTEHKCISSLSKWVRQKIQTFRSFPEAEAMIGEFFTRRIEVEQQRLLEKDVVEVPGKPVAAPVNLATPRLNNAIPASPARPTATNTLSPFSVSPAASVPVPPPALLTPSNAASVSVPQRDDVDGEGVLGSTGLSKSLEEKKEKVKSAPSLVSPPASFTQSRKRLTDLSKFRYNPNTQPLKGTKTPQIAQQDTVPTPIEQSPRPTPTPLSPESNSSRRGQKKTLVEKESGESASLEMSGITFESPRCDAKVERENARMMVDDGRRKSLTTNAASVSLSPQPSTRLQCLRCSSQILEVTTTVQAEKCDKQHIRDLSGSSPRHSDGITPTDESALIYRITRGIVKGMHLQPLSQLSQDQRNRMNSTASTDGIGGMVGMGNNALWHPADNLVYVNLRCAHCIALVDAEGRQSQADDIPCVGVRIVAAGAPLGPSVSHQTQDDRTYIGDVWVLGTQVIPWKETSSKPSQSTIYLHQGQGQNDGDVELLDEVEDTEEEEAILISSSPIAVKRDDVVSSGSRWHPSSSQVLPKRRRNSSADHSTPASSLFEAAPSQMLDDIHVAHHKNHHDPFFVGRHGTALDRISAFESSPHVRETQSVPGTADGIIDCDVDADVDAGLDLNVDFGGGVGIVGENRFDGTENMGLNNEFGCDMGKGVDGECEVGFGEDMEDEWEISPEYDDLSAYFGATPVRDGQKDVHGGKGGNGVGGGSNRKRKSFHM